nr:arsenate reductase (glutaredoxin) [Ruegeria arenilitoris]
MAVIEYWHNPRCSKSRAGLALLQDRGAEVTVRRYLEDAPSADELRAVLSRLGIPAIEMIRRGEARFKELGLSRETPEEALVHAMAENPILIERPIGITTDKAAIGRPPETLLTLL